MYYGKLQINYRQCGLHDVSGQYHITCLEHGLDGLRLQRGIHRTERRPMRSVRGWDIQNYERQCGVHELWNGNLFFYGRRDDVNDLRGMSCKC